VLGATDLGFPTGPSARKDPEQVAKKAPEWEKETSFIYDP
jgi:hypothetical protein